MAPEGWRAPSISESEVVTYEHSVKRVRERDWKAIQDAWLGEVGQLNLDPSGRAPDGELKDIPALVNALAFPKEKVEHRQDIVGVRASMLHEALYLLHKAGSVLVTAHDQAYGGSATWSLATSYQAGLFAAEATMRLLGVAIVSLDPHKHFIVDAWPPAERGLSKKQLANYRLGSEIHLVRLASSVSHFHRWAVFQRLLNTCSGLPFDRELVQAICELQDREFADQRNDLHYATTWRFGDLHAYIEVPDAFSPKVRAELLNALQPESEAFGMALGTTLFLLALALLNDLAKVAPQIEAERGLLVAACDAPRMKLRAPYEAAIAP